MGKLQLSDLVVSYGSKEIVSGLSLTVQSGEMVSILGPSGVGKTSILKAVAGLLKPAAGDIVLNDELITHTPAEKRDTVLIFQQPLLFPHMTVGQNVGFGLRTRGRMQAADYEKIHEFLSYVQLNAFENRKPEALSGGQQQRVALARALITEPALLLLDEPLSSLDSTLRREMRELIRTLQRTLGTTMLFVTHDQSEALTLSDRVALLLNGTIRQFGSPQDLVYRPLDFDVAEFFGNNNRIAGRVENGMFSSRFGCFKLPAALQYRNHVTATIRPEHIRLSQRGNGVETAVEEVQFEGSYTRVKLKAAETCLIWQTHSTELAAGQSIYIECPPEHIWFPTQQQGE
ncbi:MAG: ABC transporter ATP-binding protein [candidate division KSB1 bacterium]|nr:ABC transporter ATP-binding protein [candidate division KSB1 bacterium]